MKTSTPKESQVEQAVVRYCRKVGYFTRKFVSPASAGVPDRIVAHRGRVLFLELKREGTGKLTPLQEHEQGLMRAAGLEVRTAYGTTQAIQTVVQFFGTDCI